ncbi:MAG: hypothetical protein KTR32_18590 [Granulosicoccus sp.]|nr:hypothetical protein [Granulosicoccus sp.]
MRALTLSLIFFTLCTIVGLGWTLDRLFNLYSNESSTEPLAVYQNMGQQLSTLLDQQALPERLLDQWPESQNIALDYIQEEALPVPNHLLTEFREGEPLILESDVDVSIYYYLPSHGDVLSLTPLELHPARNTRLKFLLTGLFYTGVGLLLLVWLYPLIKRLIALRKTAVEFGQGHLQQRIHTGGLSYIGDIETEFNRMADRIQTLIADNKLLSSAVSHDLRTPLARLRFGIDTLGETPDIATQEVYIKRLSNDLDEMEKLVSSLLSFARLDNVMSEATSSNVDLAQLVSECASLHAESDKTLDTKNIHSAAIQGNADFLAMLTNNLINNAMNHAHSTVRVALLAHKETISLEVADDGPGIPEEQRQSIMQPFHRGEGQSNGHGLGLAIVARVAQWHGATVGIEDCPQLHGALFRVRFPLNRR